MWLWTHEIDLGQIGWGWGQAGADGQVPSPEFSVEQSVSLTVDTNPSSISLKLGWCTVGQPLDLAAFHKLLDRLVVIQRPSHNSSTVYSCRFVGSAGPCGS